MKDKTHFYDPLYDYVTFAGAESQNGDPTEIFDIAKEGAADLISTKFKAKQILPFLNSFEFNRLNFLRQSGFVFLVYPSSTHTRYAHSIGCCYLGYMACRQITVFVQHPNETNQDKKLALYDWLEERGWREEFLLSLLLHDLGHFPFSHTLESNSELWQALGTRIKHEDLTCELIIETPPKEGEEYKSFKNFVKWQIGDSINTLECDFISDIIEKNNKSNGDKLINPNLICYLISGEQKYIKKIPQNRRLELKIAHALVSGLLDLDRIDHYRRDSYFSGLKYASNLNFSGLLGGMTLQYRVGDPVKKYKFSFSRTAIGHVLTLLHSKERLETDCFEDIENIAYNAMLHRAINLYLGIDDFQDKKLDNVKTELAYELFFMTDDALLHKLMIEGGDKVREIIVRILNKKPYFWVAKVNLEDPDFKVKNIRAQILKNANELTSDDLILIHGKVFEEGKVKDEWMDLSYLHDENGKRLENIPDYKGQIDYFKGVQALSYVKMWFFTPAFRKEHTALWLESLHTVSPNCEMNPEVFDNEK